MKKYVGYVQRWTRFFLLALAVAVVVMLAMDVEKGVIMIVVASVFGVMIIGDYIICFYGMKITKKDNRDAQEK